MVCKYARFVIHYRNGLTVVEERETKSFWDDLPDKEYIHAIGLLFDPIPLNLVIEEEGKKMQVRYSAPEHSLKGSSRWQRSWFQYKRKTSTVARNIKEPSKVVSLLTGMIVDKQGSCVCMEVLPSMSVRTFFTTIHSLGLNLELFGIDLEEVNEPYMDDYSLVVLSEIED